MLRQWWSKWTSRYNHSRQLRSTNLKETYVTFLEKHWGKDCLNQQLHQREKDIILVQVKAATHLAVAIVAGYR